MAFLRLAYLSRIRNVPSGLHTRSLILEHLSQVMGASTSEIAKQIPVTVSTVSYHLRNMAREDIVEFSSKTRKWKLAKIHQMPLSKFITISNNKQ